MNIWDSPQAVIKGQNATRLVDKTYYYNFTDWTLETYFTQRGLKRVENILDHFFDPITTEIDAYDDGLTKMEQQMTTALKQLRNLMVEYTIRDAIDDKFVL